MKITVEVTDEELEAETRKVFGRDNKNWSKTPAYNHMFLQTIQRYANDRVFVLGHLFLNEVYDMLSLPHTELGAVLGWTKERVVDFGVDPSVVDDDIPLSFNPDRLLGEGLL